MDYALLISLIGVTLIGSVTPGPNNILLMSQGLRMGFRSCIPYILGVAVGFASLLIASIFGLSALTERLPFLLKFVTFFGAIWLAWFAWGYLKAGLIHTRGDAAIEAHASESAALKRKLGFKEAIIFQWINPKGLYFALLVASSYAALHPNVAVRLIVIVGTFNIAGALGNTLWAAAGSVINTQLSDGRWARLLNIIMGIVILATALYVLILGLAQH